MATKVPPCPKIVPIPDGYRRAKPEEVTKGVLAFARVALEHALPIGKQQTTVINDSKKGPRTIIALTEWHYDNHPSGGKGPPYWHPGISMLVPKVQQAVTVPVNPFPTEDQTLASLKSKTNPYA